MIGIISALALETDMLLKNSSVDKKETVCGIEFHEIKIKNKDIVVAVCGVGKVNAARVTQAMILKYDPSLIINTGVAGALSPDLSIGDIVIASKVLQHDMDTTALGDEAGFLSTPPLVYIPADEKAKTDLISSASSLSYNVKEGIVASGDKFVANEEEKLRIRALFSADACEMEGAAIGQVCYLSSVPFAVVRAISDGGNSDSPMDYPTFVRFAAERGAALLESFLSL